MLKWLTLAIVLVGCGSGPNMCYPEASYPNYTYYEISVTGHTPAGIAVDDPTGQLDLARVDRTVQNVMECLADLRTRPLSGQEHVDAQCYGTPTLEIRACFIVKLAPDWYPSKCSTEELFPCDVPNSSCTSKGLVPTAECPCQCRAMIQDNTVLVTTPNLRLFPAYLTTLLTGCNYPWTERLAPCSSANLAR